MNVKKLYKNIKQIIVPIKIKGLFTKTQITIIIIVIKVIIINKLLSFIYLYTTPF